MFLVPDLAETHGISIVLLAPENGNMFNNKAKTEALAQPNLECGLTMAKANGWVLLITAVFYLSFVPRIGFGPLMPLIGSDLGINHAEAGALFLSLSFGYCVGLLTSGLVSSRLTHRNTITISALGVGVVLIALSFSASLIGLHVGLASLGASAGIYLPSGVAAITGMVREADWQRALALHELSPNLSFITAPLLTEFLLRWLPWRGVLVTFGVVAIVGGLIFQKYGRGGRQKGITPGPKAIWDALRDQRLWGLMLIFGLALGAILGVYMMLPLYLVSEAGWERVDANTLVAFSRVPGLLMLIFVSGWLGDKLGQRKTMAVTIGTTGAITILLGLLSGIPLALCICIQPLLGVCFFPVGFAMLSQVNPLGVSFAIPAAMLIGGGAIPAFIGWWAKTNSFSSAMVILGLVTLIGALSILLIGARSQPEQSR